MPAKRPDDEAEDHQQHAYEHPEQIGILDDLNHQVQIQIPQNKGHSGDRDTDFKPGRNPSARLAWFLAGGGGGLRLHNLSIVFEST